jgi:hypothetical protein
MKQVKWLVALVSCAGVMVGSVAAHAETFNFGEGQSSVSGASHAARAPHKQPAAPRHHAAPAHGASASH